jgi:two-component system, NarL family, nitrate/nitrite response regulator NarL
MVRLAICDGDALFMDALALALRRRNHQIVGLWDRAHEALREISGTAAEALLFDHRYLEIDLPKFIHELRETRPEFFVILLTADLDPRSVADALESGADGVALKIDGVSELGRIVDVACRSPREPASDDHRRYRSLQAGYLSSQRTHLPSLTPREEEVLQQVLQGRDTTTIAKSLGVRVGTVRVHLSHIFTKIGVHSRLELVAHVARAHRVLPELRES